jgi:hypothetical protein
MLDVRPRYKFVRPRQKDLLPHRLELDTSLKPAISTSDDFGYLFFYPDIDLTERGLNTN